MSHAPSCLTCLCTLRTFVPYAPSCITWAIYVLCTLYLCALNSSFLDKFVVYQKLSVFQKLLKAIQILLFLCGSKKQPSFKLFNRGNLLSIFTTWNQGFFWGFFHVFNHQVIKFSVWTNKKPKLKTLWLIFEINIMRCIYVTDNLSNLW